MNSFRVRLNDLMKKIKKTFRRILYILLIIAAATGAGMFGAIMPNYRRQDDLTTKIEMVEQSSEIRKEEQE